MRATDTAGVSAIVTLDAAVLVIVFGVLVTSGVYGSRLAWLLGVALPLLAITMLLSRLSMHLPRRAGPAALPAVRTRRRRVNRAVFLTALSLFAIPCALGVALLAVDLLVFAQHGVGLLH
jgi:hypothetical protein